MEFANVRGVADGPPARHSAAEHDKAEQKTEELILMTGAEGPRRWRQRKSEYHHKLEHDNLELKNVIVELQQQISAHQAQKDILRDQLTYFQSCLAQAAPLVFQTVAEHSALPLRH
jgi:hypothetical protein